MVSDKSSHTFKQANCSTLGETSIFAGFVRPTQIESSSYNFVTFSVLFSRDIFGCCLGKNFRQPRFYKSIDTLLDLNIFVIVNRTPRTFQLTGSSSLASFRKNLKTYIFRVTINSGIKYDLSLITLSVIHKGRIPDENPSKSQ